jgi:type III secretory pathway component EscV
MSFWKDHLPPTLHNAAGTIIATALLAVVAVLLAFIGSVRNFPIPLWAVIASLVIIAIPLLLRVKKLHRELVATREKLANVESHLDKAQKEKLARDAKEKAENIKKKFLPSGGGFIRSWRWIV